MAASYNENDREMFAEELKAARAQKGWPVAEVADRIGFSPSTIKNIESGQRAPTPEQAELLDRAFGTPGTFTRTERRMRGVPFSAGFRSFAPHEQKARAIKTAHHSLLPGLFQINDYALATLKAHPETAEDAAKEQLAARLDRQAILYRSDPPPPRIISLIANQALYADIGGPAVMAAQTEHLLELAQMPRITVQILPNQAHSGLNGAFVIAETPQHIDTVYLETAMGGQVVESAEAAEAMTVLFDALRAEALTGSASLEVIKEAAKQWQDRISP
jgi:transcriptional regulator with XRE-family HTH domain